MSRALPVPAGRPPRILVVRVGAMGDVLHALPAVARLRAALPDAHLGWAVAPQWSHLLHVGELPGRHPERMPLVDAVHPVESKLWNRAPLSRTTLRSIGALRASLREGRYDIAIDLQGTVRSAAIARIGGHAPTFGSATPRESPAGLFYSHRVQQTKRHVVDRSLEIVEAALCTLGAVQPEAGTEVPLPRDGKAEPWWAQQRDLLCGGRDVVLLAATAGWGAKEWPPHLFAELGAALAARGWCVLLNTRPDRIDRVTARVLDVVQERYPEAAAHVHALRCTLPQLVAATRTVRAVIAGDTGPLHLAALLGVPTVGLFGPTDPRRTGPQGRRAVNLRDESSVTDHRRHAVVETGLARLSVASVLAALDQVLPQTSGMR